MSVIAMTMDDQRPLLNTYNNKMQEQQKYNEQQHINSTLASGPASPTPSGSEEPMSQQYHHQMTHYHHQHQHLSSSSSSTPTTQQHIYPKQHHYSTSTQRADNTKNVTDQKLQQQQQQQQSSEEQQLQQQQQQQQQHNVQPASVTCAVTVKAESVGVIDANHGQPLLEAEIKTLKEEQSRLAQQCADAQRREKILMRRLANKEQEFQDYVSQIAEYKAAQAPSAMALRSALLDPAVNLLFIKLKKELKTTKAKLEETQNELSAWKFTPDSNTGKRLMAKCRLLYQENEELGKMTSNGRLAKLETELSMQKSISKMLVQSQSELDEFLQELDEDVEGMQSTILLLQQELKTKSERIQALEKENEQFRQNHINNKSMTESNKDAMELQAEPPLNGDTQLTETTTKTTTTTTTKQSTTTTTTMKQDVDVAAVKVTAEPKSALAAYQEELAAAAKKDMEVCTEHIHKNAMNELSFVSQIKKEPEIQDDNMSTDINEVSSAASYYNGLPENLSLSLQTDEAVLNAARKRCLSDSSPVYEKVQFAPACGSYTPRTLPPKKSKLRLAPEDMSEQHDMLVNLPVAEEALSLVMDKEQVHSDMLAAGCEEYSDGAMGGIVGIGMAAQRILTRRRSMRQSTQPNGVIVSVGGVPAAENEIARETMLN